MSFKCKTCFKTYSRESYLLDHIPKCKHVQSPLECPFCHRVFSAYCSLSRHKKTCKSKEAKEEQDNVVVLRNFKQEITSHIDSPFVDSCMKRFRQDGFYDLVKAIYFNPSVPENKSIVACGRKHHLLVFEDDKWKVKPTFVVLDHMITTAAQIMLDEYNKPDCEFRKLCEQEKYDDFQRCLLDILGLRTKQVNVIYSFRRIIYSLIVSETCDVETSLKLVD